MANIEDSGESVAFYAALDALAESGWLIGHQCDDSDPDAESVAGEQLAFEIVWRKSREYEREQAQRFRAWAQKLLDVSEYIGTDREDASRWQCAFGCGGYSYENVAGTVTPDGGYKRTPPASHDWHTPDCRVRALAADLATD